MEVDETPRTTYNFEVEDVHNYFAEGYLVHNAKNVPEFGSPIDPTLDRVGPSAEPPTSRGTRRPASKR